MIEFNKFILKAIAKECLGDNHTKPVTFFIIKIDLYAS